MNNDYYKIETERLYVSKLTPAHITDWAGFFVDNDRLHHLGISKIESPLSASKSWIDRHIARNNIEFGQLAIYSKHDNSFIGLAGIIERKLSDINFFEITYSLLSKARGHGFATEIAQAFKQFIVEFNKTEQTSLAIGSIIHAENEASIGVTKKLGMQYERPIEIFGIEMNLYKL